MNKKHIFAILLTILLIILIYVGVYRCPLKYMFGLSCPFCGITRAITYALKFDFSKAFYYHAFWPIVLIGIIVHILYEFKVIKMNKVFNISLYVFVILNFVYYIYRLTSGSNIVYFNFKGSLLYKIFNILLNIF